LWYPSILRFSPATPSSARGDIHVHARAAADQQLPRSSLCQGQRWNASQLGKRDLPTLDPTPACKHFTGPFTLLSAKEGKAEAVVFSTLSAWAGSCREPFHIIRPAGASPVYNGGDVIPSTVLAVSMHTAYGCVSLHGTTVAGMLIGLHNVYAVADPWPLRAAGSDWPCLFRKLSAKGGKDRLCEQG
jgi:hypothetical protein